MEERLQKLLAAAGYGSRRACEALIVAGRVSVNGTTVRTLGAKADPSRDRIAVDGVPLVLPSQRVYIALHKPAGVVTTARDERGRKTVLDLVQAPGPRIFPVGRLDRDSEGLLLLTNDGDLANRLLHPRFSLDKEYFARVQEVPSQDALDRLARGVSLDGRPTAPAAVELAAPPPVVGPRPNEVWLRLVIHEGRKRQVRRMLAAVGHPVLRLIRTAIGPLRLGNLRPGQWRRLSAQEVAALRRATEGPATPRATRP
jgi:pseudouridine synthase